MTISLKSATNFIRSCVVRTTNAASHLQTRRGQKQERGRVNGERRGGRRGRKGRRGVSRQLIGHDPLSGQAGVRERVGEKEGGREAEKRTNFRMQGSRRRLITFLEMFNRLVVLSWCINGNPQLKSLTTAKQQGRGEKARGREGKRGASSVPNSNPNRRYMGACCQKSLGGDQARPRGRPQRWRCGAPWTIDDSQ